MDSTYTPRIALHPEKINKYDFSCLLFRALSNTADGKTCKKHMDKKIYKALEAIYSNITHIIATTIQKFGVSEMFECF